MLMMIMYLSLLITSPYSSSAGSLAFLPPIILSLAISQLPFFEGSLLTVVMPDLVGN